MPYLLSRVHNLPGGTRLLANLNNFENKSIQVLKSSAPPGLENSTCKTEVGKRGLGRREAFLRFSDKASSDSEGKVALKQESVLFCGGWPDQYNGWGPEKCKEEIGSSLVSRELWCRARTPAVSRATERQLENIESKNRNHTQPFPLCLAPCLPRPQKEESSRSNSFVYSFIRQTFISHKGPFVSSKGQSLPFRRH